MITDTVWKFNPWTVILFSIVSILLAFIYWDALVELLERWELQEEYSHSYLLPLVTTYFIWLKKDELAKMAFSPSWLGFSLVLFSMVVFFVGKVSILYILIQYSLIGVLIGLVWAVTGNAALKKIIVPLLILAFAIPLPYFIEVLLSAKLQLLSSQLGVKFIRWCNIPVYLEGNVIDLGVYKLQVVEACSGLRYLFPLMSLGFICAYMYDAPFWKRAVIFLSAIPITVFMNSFRIGVIGVMVEKWGVPAAEGFLHDFEGWVVFMFCLLLLLLEMFILTRIGSDARPFSEVFGLGVAELSSKQDATEKIRPVSRPFLAAAGLLTVVSLILLFSGSSREIIPERKLFYDFPLQIKAWQGRPRQLDGATLAKLHVTDYAMIDYIGDGGKSVGFYAAYYESQRRSVVPHSPRVCIPGGGWEIVKFSRSKIDQIPINRLLIKKQGAEQLVYYWYQQRGKSIANEYEMKWELFRDAVFLHRTDGALVRLTTNIFPGEVMEDADARLKLFFRRIYPLLNDFIPE